MVIYIDGPTRAGKSTLAAALVQTLPRAKVRTFDSSTTADDYAKALAEDTQPTLFPLITIWDGGWASVFIHSGASRITSDKVKSLDDSLLNSKGIGIILLGPDTETLIGLEEEYFLFFPVFPDLIEEHRESFRAYANESPWLVLENLHTDGYFNRLVDSISRYVKNGGVLREYVPVC